MLYYSTLYSALLYSFQLCYTLRLRPGLCDGFPSFEGSPVSRTLGGPSQWLEPHFSTAGSILGLVVWSGAPLQRLRFTEASGRLTAAFCVLLPQACQKPCVQYVAMLRNLICTFSAALALAESGLGE